MEVLANALVVTILKSQVYQINKYTLNLHNVVHELCLNKSGKH